MPSQELQGGRVPVKVWAPLHEVESQALDQLRNVAKLPWVFHHVAAMPDVHLGVGCTIGSVVAMKDAISPAAVGVDIGCFVGETKVPLLNGTQRSLKDLTNESKPFWVYSIGSEGNIVPGKALARKTRTDADLVVVTVSGGDEIVCTPDHQFMLRDGTYCEARNLRFNASLMPLYRRWQTRDGYESCSNGKGFTRQTHELVYEALAGPLQRGFVVHHKDHKHFNNDPDNLQLMEVGKHSAHHRATGHRLNNECQEFQARRRAGIKRRASDPVQRAKMAAVGTANITNFMTHRRGEFLKSVAGNGARGAPYLARFNVSPRACSDCGQTHPNPAVLYWHKRRVHSYNHKVVSVRPAGYRADVYCLTVEEHHNFALAAGVFVHNCGMAAIRTGLQAKHLPDSLEPLRSGIEARVPMGFQAHSKPVYADNASRLLMQFGQLVPEVQDLKGRAAAQLGTLGGGNHFIELCLDDADNVWVMLHSGSRNIGKTLAEIHIARAKTLAHNERLPDPDLAVFLAGTPEMAAYRHDLGWAQEYAAVNRLTMLRVLHDVLYEVFGSVVDERAPMGRCKSTLSPVTSTPVFAGSLIQCHHNYVDEETHFDERVLVTRKGAINAECGRLGIIPGSMGTGSYIVRGLGNPESFNSASHGAGRKMSRGQAKRQFTVQDLEDQTRGVACRKDDGMLDEIPGAYKNLDSVMANQADLVEIVHKLRTILCVKG